MSFPSAYHTHRTFLPGRVFILFNYVIDKQHASSIIELEAAVAKESWAAKEAEATSNAKGITSAKEKVERLQHVRDTTCWWLHSCYSARASCEGWR